jgi:hypothetical protein
MAQGRPDASLTHVNNHSHELAEIMIFGTYILYVIFVLFVRLFERAALVILYRFDFEEYKQVNIGAFLPMLVVGMKTQLRNNFIVREFCSIREY